MIAYLKTVENGQAATAPEAPGITEMPETVPA